MTQYPLRAGWRLLRWFRHAESDDYNALVLTAGLAACAGLPRDVQRVPSQALPASSDTELGRIAAASVPAQVSAVSALLIIATTLIMFVADRVLGLRRVLAIDTH